MNKFEQEIKINLYKKIHDEKEKINKKRNIFT